MNTFLKTPASLIVFLLLTFKPLMAQNDCLSKGKKYFEEQNFKKTVMTLRKCDDSPQAQRLLGLAYFELNFMEDARKYLEKAIDEGPDDITLKIHYADAFALNKEFRKGREEFLKLADAYPENTEVLRGLARVTGWNRNYDEAIALYRKILKNEPEDYESWIQKGILTGWDKRFSDAVDIFEKILASGPPQEVEIRARLHKAEVLSWTKKFDESISEYDKVIKISPQTAEAYIGKGKVLEWQGRYKLAVEAYKSGLEAAPDNQDLNASLQQLKWVE